MREDDLARLMFYGGCCALPWLWCVNILYFRKKVFGTTMLDTWLYGSDAMDNSTPRTTDGPTALGALDTIEHGSGKLISFFDILILVLLWLHYCILRVI